MSSYKYVVGDPGLDIELPAFKLTPDTCPYQLVTESILLHNGQSLPRAITYSETTNTLRVEAFHVHEAGEYQVRVKVNDPATGLTNSDLLIPIQI